MKLVLLSGNTKATNKKWIEEMAKVFKENFSSVYIQYYKHWEENNPDAVIDLDYELKKVIEITKTYQEQYVIFAKSAGTLVTLKGIYQKELHPTACIFVGTPILWAREHSFDYQPWLENYQIRTLFIQKTSDPITSFAVLKETVNELYPQDYQLIEMPGNTHNYEDIEKIKMLTLDFLNKK